MLYRVIIGNFTSFAKVSEFEMFPNMKRENFINHVYMNDNVPVLKECAIYGANGSGKSNFIQALQFIKSFATEFVLDRDSDWLVSFYKKNRFRLPLIGENEPMVFVIEFSGVMSAYIYTVVLDGKGVAEEALYVSGLGKTENQLLFKRTYEDIVFSEKIATDEISKVFHRQLKANLSISALGIIGRLHLIDNKYINDAYDWFNSHFNIIEVSYQIPWLVQQLSQQSDVMNFVRDVFSVIGLGIKDLSIKSETFEEWLKHADIDDKTVITKFFESVPSGGDGKAVAKMNRKFPHLTISEEDGVRTVQELVFHQMGQNGYVGDMECETQSNGTLRLLTLVPAIYGAVKLGKTVVIDEIDNSIHPILIKKMIQYFGKSDSNGQLIFTTHETALLNQQELLRPDEAWMMEKNDGITKMYSLNDFKIHKTLSLENGYIEGRFGAIPFLGDFDILSDGHQ